MNVLGRRKSAGRGLLKGLAAAWVVTGLMGPPGGWATEIEEDHTLSMEFVTPHTKWAQPYAGGRTRVLVFIDGRDTLPREIIELKQRFDLEAASVYWYRIIDTTTQKWLHAEAGVQRMMQLLDQPWDCYVLYQQPLTNLPVEGQYKLLKLVTAGAGLVFVGAADPRVLKEANRLPELPEFLGQGTPLAGLPFVQESALKNVPPAEQTDAAAARRMMTAYRVKAGRALVLPPRPTLGDDIGWDTQYEYWIQLVGRAILWSAGREPKMKLTVSVARPTAKRFELADQKITVTWSHPAAPADLTIEATLRRFDGQCTPLARQAKAPGAGSLTAAVADLRADRYFVDVRATSAKGAEGWASAGFVVTSDRQIAALELDAPYAEIGGRLAGKATLEGPLGAQEAVRIDLVDPRNRVVARTDLPVRPGALAFQFDVKPWMPMLTRVEAHLLADGKELHCRHAWFHVTKRNRGRFNFLMWDYPKGTLAPWAERALAKYGVTLQLCHGNPPNFVAANEIAWVPYTIHIASRLDKNGVMEGGCWNDPAVVEPRVRKLAAEYVPSRQHGVFVYSLGDEIATRGSCLSPHCLSAYRKYLQQEYGSVEALNASWGSTYKSFDEVTLLDPKDNSEAEAKRQGLYARWYDRQAFQSWNICQYYKKFGEAYRAIDPQSRTGFEGAGRFDDGDDYDLILRTNEFWSPYPGLGDEVIRSIAPRDFPRSNWMGYAKNAEPLIHVYWRMITRGCDAVWWWRWDALGQFHGYLAPWLAPFEATKELLQETAVVRQGLGTLLLKSRRLDDGVAILYSPPSTYANRIEAGPSYGSYTPMHEAWCRTLRELRLEFRYVTDRMLRLGEFKPGDARVLLLAHAEALGPKEAAVIRAFVEAGGTLLADVRPGLYTDRCKPRLPSPVDELFGIKRQAPAAARMGTVKIAGEFGDVTLDAMRCDPSVTLAGARALGTAGDVPVVIVNRVGRGQAVLLNFSLAGWPALWSRTAPEAPAAFLQRLLASAGVKPALEVVDKDGKRARDLEVTRWQNGQMQIISLFRQGGTEETLTLKLPEARTLYDLRSGQCLGSRSTVEVAVKPVRPTWLALAPAPVPDLKLSAADRVTRGKVLSLTVEVPGAAGLHAAKLSVRTPDGDEAEWLAQEVMAGAQAVSCELPVAFNDPVGRWTIEARDLYTGKITRLAYTVE